MLSAVYKIVLSSYIIVKHTNILVALGVIITLQKTELNVVTLLKCI